jgi:hypothetical protein
VNERQTHIREVFLRPLESYGLPAVARLTGIPPGKLRREVRLGYRDAVKVGREWRFAWRQLAFVAFDVWTLAEIHAALGPDACRVLPPLLALRAVTVTLPEYIVLALESIAAEDRTTVDAALGSELVELAGTHLTWLGGTIPGYREAYFFPGQPVRAN